MSIQLVFTDFLDLSFSLSTRGTLPLLYGASVPSGDFTLERDVLLATMKNAFYFQTDDPITYDSSYTRYYVDISGWSETTLKQDLNPMNYEVTSTGNGAYGMNTTDDLAKHFLRYLAEKLFGTHLGVDLFENEDEVYRDISQNSFNAVFTTVLNRLKLVDKTYGASSTLHDICYNAVGGYHMLDSPEPYNICRNLVKQFASNNVDKTRFQNLELKTGVGAGAGVYHIPFRVGDSIYFSVIVAPDPYQHLVTGLTTPIDSRNYILKMNIV
jgi:hypothetical protein